MRRKNPGQPPRLPQPPTSELQNEVSRARRLWRAVRRRAALRPKPLPAAPRRADTTGNPDGIIVDYRTVKTLPYVLASRYRTVNAILLLVALAFLIMVASPAAAQAVNDHAAFLSSAIDWAADHAPITALVLAGFAGRVGWTVWKGGQKR